MSSTYSSDTYASDTYDTGEQAVEAIPSRASIPFTITPIEREPEPSEITRELLWQARIKIVGKEHRIEALQQVGVLQHSLCETACEIEIKTPVEIDGVTVYVTDSMLDTLSARELQQIANVAKVALATKIVKIAVDTLEEKGEIE